MPGASLDLDSTVGGVFIGGLFSTLFYGFSCAQLAHYCYHYLRRDRASVVILVFCTWLLDTVITVSDFYILWYFVIRGHGNEFDLLVFPKNAALVYDVRITVSAGFLILTYAIREKLEYASTCVTICVVQIFYVHGIWQLLMGSPTKARIAITLLPAMLSLLSLAFGFVGTKVATEHGWIVPKTLPADTLPTAVKVCAAAVADVCICIALSWALRRKMTGFRRTDGLIRTLTAYIINRGILTTIMQIALLGTYMASVNQDKLIWAIFHCAGGKVYVNSMMAVLNARRHLSSGVSHVSGF